MHGVTMKFNMATVRPFCLESDFIAINGCRSYECVFVIEVGREYAYVLCRILFARHGDDARLLRLCQSDAT